VIGGITIYYLGPENAIEAAKAALVVAETAQKIPATLPPNRVQENSKQQGAVKKEDKTQSSLILRKTTPLRFQFSSLMNNSLYKFHRENIS